MGKKPNTPLQASKLSENVPGFDPSLKDGLGAMPSTRNPLAGTRPSGECFMQMVPPVMMIRTRASGYCVAILSNAAAGGVESSGRSKSLGDPVSLKCQIKPDFNAHKEGQEVTNSWGFRLVKIVPIIEIRALSDGR